MTTCKHCGGKGRRAYGSTSTWHGGIGGAAMTADLCDKCWGSGDSDQPFMDIRKLLRAREAEIQRRMAQWFAEASGAHIERLRPAVLEIVGELERITRKRKEGAPFRDNVAKLLARKLREVAER